MIRNWKMFSLPGQNYASKKLISCSLPDKKLYLDSNIGNHPEVHCLLIPFTLTLMLPITIHMYLFTMRYDDLYQVTNVTKINTQFNLLCTYLFLLYLQHWTWKITLSADVLPLLNISWCLFYLLLMSYGELTFYPTKCCSFLCWNCTMSQKYYLRVAESATVRRRKFMTELKMENLHRRCIIFCFFRKDDQFESIDFEMATFSTSHRA